MRAGTAKCLLVLCSVPDGMHGEVLDVLDIFVGLRSSAMMSESY